MTGSVVGIGVAEMGVAWWMWKGNISAHYRIATAIGSKVIHRIFFQSHHNPSVLSHKT